MNYLISPPSRTVKTISLNAGWLYLLTSILAVLKWQGVITWSWWLVLSPVWVPWLLVAIALCVMGLAVLGWLLLLISRGKQ